MPSSSSSSSSPESSYSFKEEPEEIMPLELLSSYTLPDEPEDVNPLSLLRLDSLPEEIKPLTLLSSDGEKFTVEPKVALQSGTLRNMIEAVQYSGVIRVPKANAKALAVVIIYCTEHANKTGRGDLKQLEKFDNNLLGKLDEPLLCQIMEAATQLCIQGLQEAISRTVANKEYFPTTDKEEKGTAASETNLKKISKKIKKPFNKFMVFVKAHSSVKSHRPRAGRPLMLKKG